MLGFIVLLVVCTLAACVWTVAKYRRDLVLAVVAWLAVRWYERRK